MQPVFPHQIAGSDWALTRAMRDTTGNLPPLPGIFPDTLAPVVRHGADRVRELVTMRWGFPPPPKVGTRPVTNLRNLKSPYWRARLKPEFRCLVPATSFCEFSDATPKVTHWFALDETRPLFCFAGLWRPWTGERRKETREHLLFAFLTCETNETVRPVHARAMPVILTSEDEREAWLNAPLDIALGVQKPCPNAMLRVVAQGELKDGLAA